MQKPQEFLEKFVQPWLDENHPNAAIVMVAGSYGRALKNGGFQPVASSDFDLIVIYNDLADGGFLAAAKTYTYENIAPAMGGPDRTMMIDVNIHDFDSLAYQDIVVRDHKPYPFLHCMISEGYVLLDKTGRAPELQAQAKIFLEEGAGKMSKAAWQMEIDNLKTQLNDIRSSDSLEEKRFIGATSLFGLSSLLLRLEGLWPDGSNYAVRWFADYCPEQGERVLQAFSTLLRTGDSVKAEALFEDIIARAEKMTPAMPDASPALPYPVDRHVPAAEQEMMRNTFLKFISGHVCDAFEAAPVRGELYYLQTLSAVLFYTQLAEVFRAGAPLDVGRKAMHFFNDRLPDMLPVVLQSLDEGIHAPLRQVIDKSFSDVGGLHYSHLQNYYDEDLARVYATKRGAPPLKNDFKPGYKP